MIPAEPAALDALAAEYVLGTLSAREAEAVRDALPDNPALADAVAAWEQRLAPLSALAPPEAPPAGLWARIERAQTGGDAPAAIRPAPPRPWRDPWRWGALGAAAAAASLALLMVLRPAEPPRLMTVLLTSQQDSAWIVEADRERIRLAALNPRPAPPDRVLQLWALPQGETVPTSLGLLPPEGRVEVRPTTIRPQPGMLIEITLEPPGGSPTGRPTGPIQFIGRLAPATGG
jgi:anti-sigma-K factor RskA